MASHRFRVVLQWEHMYRSLDNRLRHTRSDNAFQSERKVLDNTIRTECHLFLVDHEQARMCLAVNTRSHPFLEGSSSGQEHRQWDNILDKARHYFP